MICFADKEKYFPASILGLLLFLSEAHSFAQIISDHKKISSILSIRNIDSSYCINNFQHTLLREDSTILTANFITMTRDGNFLVPGYYYPNRGIYYKMPYLIKCTAKGNILWSKGYPSKGNYPSNWFTANRIKELANGDLLMIGEIGVPGTDDRRELAVWRLDKNGNQIWAESYESSLWKDPITGSTEITGIQEDEAGNIFLSGNLKFFETSRFAFLLKINSKGIVIWDKNFSSYNPLAFGLVLDQNKLQLIGSSGPFDITPGLRSNLLWTISLDPNNGDTISTKAWYADFDQQSFANSFAYANTNVTMLDNGQIAVSGTANSDFLAFVGQVKDTIWHSIVANFSPDFDFANGIMLGSKHSTNYYNTVTTEHSNGRISFTRFSENHDLYNEDIIYGNIQNDNVNRERLYHEKNRSAATVSNFLFYKPSEDILVQSYTDSTTKSGGLEIIRLDDSEVENDCSGTDTNLTFTQQYFMRRTTMKLDSIVSGTIHFSYHNFVNESQGNLTKINACQLTNPNVHYNPIVSLNKDSIICKGSTHQLTAGNGYSQYLWSNGNTNSSILISDLGKYWVSVTDQNGCKGSDTTSIAALVLPPASFLPHDTSVCLQGSLTVVSSGIYKQYQWNDLSNGQTLTVKQPGFYWLQVVDSNNCVGTDTIQVSQVNCNHELLVPNAFTPNGDGLNDVFEPKFFSDIIKFRFTVYNRWGEKVFETESLHNGWDGKLSGVPQKNGVFVWFCQYQIIGEALKNEKGTVMLIR